MEFITQSNTIKYANNKINYNKKNYLQVPYIIDKTLNYLLHII